MKSTKYSYYYVLQGHYSMGWEDLSAEDKNSEGRKNILQTMRDYRLNEKGVYRIISRREINK